MKDYKKMFERAASKTFLGAETGKLYFYHKGHTGANALSAFVEEKYNVNAVSNGGAHDALCETLAIYREEEL